MRSSEYVDINSRVKADNGFLPSIKDKCSSHPGDLDCKHTCREAKQREYCRRDVSQSRRNSLHTREFSHQGDVTPHSQGKSRSLNISPNKLPDIDRSKCSSVGSVWSLPSSRGSKISSLHIPLSSHLTMCKSPSCPQLESLADLHDDLSDSEEDIKDAAYTYPMSTRLKPVVENLKLPDIVCPQESSRQTIEGIIDVTRRDLEMYTRPEDETAVTLTPRTHGNTLLPITPYNMKRKKKHCRKEPRRSSDCSNNATDFPSLDTEYQPFQRSKLSRVTVAMDTSERLDSNGPVDTHRDSNLRSEPGQASVSSVDGAINSIAEENCARQLHDDWDK